jgi:hypothetical protein
MINTSALFPQSKRFSQLNAAYVNEERLYALSLLIRPTEFDIFWFIFCFFVFFRAAYVK